MSGRSRRECRAIVPGSEVAASQGNELFLNGKYAEAFPLLSAGFAARENASFSHPDELGVCALALGLLRGNKGDRSGALDAFAVALDVFQGSKNRELEGTTLNNVGGVYYDLGRYDEALNIVREDSSDSIEVALIRISIAAVFPSAVTH